MRSSEKVALARRNTRTNCAQLIEELIGKCSDLLSVRYAPKTAPCAAHKQEIALNQSAIAAHCADVAAYKLLNIVQQ